MAAAAGGYLDTIKVLLDNKASIDELDVNNWSALFWATKKGFTDTVKLLIDNRTLRLNSPTRIVKLH